MPSPYHSVFAGQMPFVHPTNNVKALKAKCHRLTEGYNIKYFPSHVGP